MSLPRCRALILFGRNGSGNRAGLVTPRTCRRVATHGEYCGLHAHQAALQGLYRDIFGFGWEYKVQTYEERQRRIRVQEGMKAARVFEKAARDLRLDKLAFFLSVNQSRVAEEWAEAASR